MINQFVWRSKRKIELIPITADFSKDLAIGDLIDSCEVSISVFAGEDNSPSDMLYAPVEVFSPRCIQQIIGGVVGVTYLVEFTATTVLGNLLVQYTKLSILPDNIPASGKYIPIYFTTWPYPYYLIDTLGIGTTPQNGDMHQTYDIYLWKDATSINTIPTTGQLQSVVITYTGKYIDSTTISQVPTSGLLKKVLEKYSMQADSMSLGIIPSSGYLKQILIRYANYTDSMTLGNTPISGSLST